MEIMSLIIAGLAGGLIGGTGMGGGTLLIPVLTLLCGFSQHAAQATNLISFIPMAAASLATQVSSEHSVARSVRERRRFFCGNERKRRNASYDIRVVSYSRGGMAACRNDFY